MSSPFFLSAPLLRANQYSVLPLMPNSKRPAIEKWSEYGINPVDEETFQRWLKWQNCGIGVCLGVASNLIGIDFDYDVDGLHDQIKAMLPPTPVGKVGQKGCTLFYQFNGQKSQSYSRNGERVLDILSTGRQTVLPPTIHPETGKPYTWMGEQTLLNTLAADLPQVSLEVMYAIGNLITPVVHHTPKAREIQVYDDTTLEEVSDALTYIPADDYDTWYKVGMCLKHKFGYKAYEIWNNWSATSEKYKAHEMASKWNSFTGTGLTVASLFYFAMDYGYVPKGTGDYEPPTVGDFVWDGKKTGWNEAPKAAPKPQFVAEEAVQAKDEPQQKKTDSINFPSKLLKAPGLIGRLAAYVNETAITPQPVLSLGASIGMAGAIMGRKVRGPSKLRTNLYILGLAPSGAGKDHARSMFKQLLKCAGYDKIELPVPASSAGLVSSLRERAEGRGIVLWDEFGRVLKQLTGWSAGNHERDIVTALIELFSSAQSTYMGKGYANHDGKNPIKPIEQPCLSIYGTSVPGHFYEALSGNDAVDGFLSRWLIFESRDYSTEIIIPDEDTTYDVPQHLIDEVKKWKDVPFYNGADVGNLADATQVVPKLITYTPEAKEILIKYAKETRLKSYKLDMERDNTAAVWSRSGEHAMRLALVGHEGDSISREVAEWAIGVAEYCSIYMSNAIADFVSSSELESQTKRVLKAIRDKGGAEGWVSKADITRCFQGVQARTRNEILASLMERGEIIEDRTGNTGGRAKLRYRAA